MTITNERKSIKRESIDSMVRAFSKYSRTVPEFPDYGVYIFYNLVKR